MLDRRYAQIDLIYAYHGKQRMAKQSTGKEKMTDKQPMQAQWEEVLKWCGFKFISKKEDIRFGGKQSYWDTVDYWLYPDGHKVLSFPPLDLNSLFEFAVPKLREAVRDYEAHYILSECIRLSFSIKDKLDDRIVKAILEVI